ncbi:MAG TPA: 6-phosphofructokinase, partial [Burkholderiales bacterium]|nr:6-phosphofructokinase [Burkholderiales bacterium]
MKTSKAPNALYAQSGGPSAVINASAAGVIEAVRKARGKIGKLYAGRNGIVGILTEELIDTGRESASAVARLRQTPGSAFGTCRYKLRDFEKDRSQYERLIEVFRAYDIGYFFYNGGNDSMDTAWKVSQLGAQLGLPVQCIG